MYINNELVNDRITYLIFNSIKGQLTEDHQKELHEWRAHSEVNENLFNEISSRAPFILDLWNEKDSRNAFAKLKGRLEQARKRRQYMIWASAAASILIAFSIWILYPNLTNDQLLEAKTISPGKYGAQLFVNGRNLDLSKNSSGLVVKEHGLSFADGTALSQEEGSSSANELTASTAKGFTYHLELSDGTIVWLNANSKLQFPSSFKNLKNRNVYLQGEAYFVVKHNAAQPFIVHSPRSVTEDIGTAFNVKDYQNDASAKSTLIEGSTMVFPTGAENAAAGNRKGTLLKPGQQATIADETLKINTVDLEEITSWKSGYFRFNNTKITEIMKNLSMWYDIEVYFDGKVSEEGYYGTISRNKTLYEVLRMLEDTKLVNFTVKGRRVYVKTKNN
jgi:transmembrane sensor